MCYITGGVLCPWLQIISGPSLIRITCLPPPFLPAYTSTIKSRREILCVNPILRQLLVINRVAEKNCFSSATQSLQNIPYHGFSRNAMEGVVGFCHSIGVW